MLLMLAVAYEQRYQLVRRNSRLLPGGNMGDSADFVEPRGTTIHYSQLKEEEKSNSGGAVERPLHNISRHSPTL